MITWEQQEKKISSSLYSVTPKLLCEPGVFPIRTAVIEALMFDNGYCILMNDGSKIKVGVFLKVD